MTINRNRKANLENNPWFRALLVLLVIALALHIAGLLWQLSTHFADIILLFFLAWLVAFLLRPLVQFLSRFRYIPRVAAAALVYLGLIMLIVGLGALVIPATAGQLYQLGATIPAYVERVPLWAMQAQSWLRERGILIEFAALVQSDVLMNRAQGLATAIGENALAIAQGVATTIFASVIMLVLSFYFTLDGERLSRRMVYFLPQQYQADANFFLQNVERAFGGFIRGSFLLAFIYGAGTAIVMVWQQLDFVLPVSFFAGLVMIIPFIGTFLAIIPPVVIALFGGSLGKALAAFISLLILQQIVLQIVAPKVMGESVGIHPLLVMLAILVGFQVAGVWGAIFGVPLAAALYTTFLFLYDRASRRPPSP